MLKDIEQIAEIVADKIIIKQVSPRWLKLKDASNYSAIGQRKLKLLAQEGKIRGFQDTDSLRGDWIFDKLSLDEYRESQMGDEHQKAIEILNTVIL